MADPKDLAAQLSAFNAIEAEQPWYKKQLPMEGRATFLPFRDTMEGSVFNQREVALPGILAGALNAFSAPERARTGSDPAFNASEEAANMALNTFGGGIATGKALRNPTGQGGVDLSMNAWHGTPHEVKGNFDLAKVGTGEGAQMYGHGIYTSLDKDFASKFKPRDLQYEENLMKLYSQAEKKGDYNSMEVLESAMLHATPNDLLQQYPAQTKLIEQIRGIPQKSSLYKVDVPDEQIPLMLDWDAPITQQPKLLQILKDNPVIANELKAGKSLDELKGSDVYLAFASNFDAGQKEAYKLASENLNSLGIPGIKYLERNSKQPDGVTNLVSFQPETIKILERNDIPVRRQLLQQEFDKLEK
jgi:hypothetical protein